MNISTLLTNRLRRADLLHWNTLWLALYIIGIGIFFIAMPKYFDDHRFSFFCGEWYHRQGIMDITGGGDMLKFGIPWDAIKEQWIALITKDNARLVNIIDTPLVLLPKWVGSSICLLAWAYTIFGMFKLARIDWRKSALVSLSIFLVFFCFPWEDSMSCFIFHFNYTIPSAVAVTLLLLLRTHKPGWKHTATIAFLGLISGCMHEAFSLPLLASLIINIIIFPSSRNRNTYALCATLTLGIIWLISVPAFQSRTGRIDSYFLDSILSIAKRIGKVTLTNPAFWVITVTTITIGIKKCVRLFLSDPICAIFYTGIPLSLILSAATEGTPRAAWWCDLMAFCAVPYLLNRFYFDFFRGYSRRNYALSAICLITALGLTAVADAMTIKTIGENKKMLMALQEDPDSMVFNDWFGTSDNLLFKFAKFNLLTMAHDSKVIGTLPPTADGVPQYQTDAHCIPAKIADFLPSKAKRIKPGNAYIYKKELIIDTTANLPINTFGNITFGNIEKQRVYSIQTTFRSTADGRTYYHITPADYFWLRKLFGISSVEIKDKKPTR